jgi:hypothetical protein
MRNRNFFSLAAVMTAGLSLGIPVHAEAATVTLAPPPVTAGLFVELNGDNLTTPGALSIWQDQANDGNPGTYQNFVQDLNVDWRPTVVLDNPMPNGLQANVVNFARGAASGSNSSSSTSDRLYSVAGGVDGSTTLGADAAYNGNEQTYFVVFQSTLGGTTADNRQRATVFQQGHTGGAGRFVTTFHQGGFDANGGPLLDQAGTTANLYSAIRQSDNVQGGAGIADTEANRWYIAATSWNTVTGAVRMVFYDDQGVVTERSFSDILPDGLGVHELTFLGSSSSNSSSGMAFNGNMAELLIYNTALDTFDTNKVINYLNDKYFGASTVLQVPEPNSLIIAMFGALGAAGYWHRRKRTTHAS